MYTIPKNRIINIYKILEHVHISAFKNDNLSIVDQASKEREREKKLEYPFFD